MQKEIYQFISLESFMHMKIYIFKSYPPLMYMTDTEIPFYGA